MTDPAGNATATLVNGLGAASLGLGLTEIVAPGKVAALSGVDDTKLTRRVIRALGVRECGHGAALFGGPNALVWTRVAGDVLDLTLLSVGVARRGRGRRRTRGPRRRRRGALSRTARSRRDRGTLDALARGVR